jgi:hypothetical protein
MNNCLHSVDSTVSTRRLPANRVRAANYICRGCMSGPCLSPGFSTRSFDASSAKSPRIHTVSCELFIYVNDSDRTYRTNLHMSHDTHMDILCCSCPHEHIRVFGNSRCQTANQGRRSVSNIGGAQSLPCPPVSPSPPSSFPFLPSPPSLCPPFPPLPLPSLSSGGPGA